MGLLEKKRAIEEEIARTQKNKKTEYHLGKLKGKLAQLKTEILEAANKGSKEGDGFDVRKSGDVRVALVGFPSVGKSSFLNQVTKTESVAASYEFTTLTCIPGVLEYNGTEIQVLDLPGIIEGAAEGKGRGRQVISTARTADLILLMMDASKAEVQRKKLTYELESVGIRLNQQVPNIYFKKKPGCSMNNISYSCTCGTLTKGLSEKLVKDLLKEYKIFNAEVIIREDVTVDEFIDIIEGNRRYANCLHIYNKIDCIPIEEVDRLARLPHSVVLSLEHNMNVEEVKYQIWQHLNLIRVFTKKKGEAPDFSRPFIMRSLSTVDDVCRRIHKDIISKFKYALVWGTSARHEPQRVGVKHVVEDEDVIQVATSGVSA
eukprot:PhF_6_TR20824/c0_g1_i1/m.29975/K06944/K06944; uncharacterized protein